MKRTHYRTIPATNLQHILFSFSIFCSKQIHAVLLKIYSQNFYFYHAVVLLCRACFVIAILFVADDDNHFSGQKRERKRGTMMIKTCLINSKTLYILPHHILNKFNLSFSYSYFYPKHCEAYCAKYFDKRDVNNFMDMHVFDSLYFPANYTGNYLSYKRSL